MPFNGGPLDGQPVTPDTLGQAEQSGAVDINQLLQGIPGGGGQGLAALGDGGPPQGAPPPGPGGPPPDLMAAMTGGAPPAASPEGGPPPEQAPAEPELSEGERLDRIISDMLSVAGGGELSQKSKLNAQKAMTLLQQIKADEEQEQHDALGGKLSPRLLSKAYGG